MTKCEICGREATRKYLYHDVCSPCGKYFDQMFKDCKKIFRETLFHPSINCECKKCRAVTNIQGGGY